MSKSKYRKYTPEEHAFLRDYVPGHSYREIRDAFNERFTPPIRISQVNSYVGNNGLNTGRTGRFEEGQAPHNKGQRIPGGYPGSRKSMFRPGQVPHNRKEIGERVKRADGYWWTKVQDGHKNANWRATHVLIWEEAHGEVPADHVVFFANGDTDDLRLENLALVPRAELATMNKMGLKPYDQESLKTARLAVKVMRAAHARRKEAKR